MKKLLLNIFAVLFIGLSLSSCDALTKDVEVELPPFESQLILESYLTDGQPIKVALMETKDYFKDLDTPFIDDAIVTLSYGGKTDTLREGGLDTFTLKYFNYRSNDTINLQEGEIYTIRARDSKGREAVGSATYSKPVQIDSLEVRPQPDGKYSVYIKYMDKPGNTYYRFRVRRQIIGLINDTLTQDYFTDDALFRDQSSAFGTGNLYSKGEFLEITLYTLSEDYYNFLNTAYAAASANGNPFAQPASIQSNVQGGTGIVTCLSYDRRYVKVE